MNEDYINKFLFGVVSLLLGVIILYLIRAGAKKYEDTVAANFRLYISAMGFIILGLILIYEYIFSK